MQCHFLGSQVFLKLAETKEHPVAQNVVKKMPTDWIKTNCCECESQIFIHKDWKNPDLHCGSCKLISGKFVDAIEITLMGNHFISSENVKSLLRSLIEDANIEYNKNLKKSVDKSTAWRAAERDLANRVWNDKELRKEVFLAIKVLERTRKEDEKAELRNEQRAAHTTAGTRRWSG